jgi:O-acetyl-ADP-ribose deacetylase (regulator of RNase III)
VNQFVTRLLREDGRTVEIHGPADITEEATEAIVNAANSHLIGGGGVDGAIHRAGGPSILQECQRIVAERGRLPAGQAVITTGGRMAARYVIHTVGPIYRGGDGGEAETLASCYREAIRLAHERDIKSLAFPSISTGAYGYPVTAAAEIAMTAVTAALAAFPRVQTVRFVLFDTSTLNAYVRASEKLARSQTEYSHSRNEKGSR